MFTTNHFPLFHFHRFLRNPSELKSIKNISLLRQQMNQSASGTGSTPSTPTTPTFTSPFSSSPTPPARQIKIEPLDSDSFDEPTDLSIGNGTSRDAYIRDRENHRHNNHRDNRDSVRDREDAFLDNKALRMELEKYDTSIKLEYTKEKKSEDYGENNNTSMHLQLNIKNQNITSPQDLTLTKHESVHYETTPSYA